MVSNCDNTWNGDKFAAAHPTNDTKTNYGWEYKWTLSNKDTAGQYCYF
jgi:hypothetical protein